MPRKYIIYDRLNRPQLKQPEWTKDYIEYEVHLEKKSTGAGVDDFEIIEVVEEKKTNIVEFINSYNDKAGLESLLKRISITGDLSLLNQKEPIYMDTTIIPDDPEEAFKMANGGAAEAFAKLDPALTEGQDMESFIKGLTPEKLEKYIQSKIEASKKAEGESK